MIPSPFAYVRPTTLADAITALASSEEAKLLAGGHSLIPAMKFRLAQPKTIVDLGRISDLSYIREQDGRIGVGAMATHRDIESSSLLLEKCPLLPQVAAQIGDVQVRNRGTIGGSCVHADPAADWPAAILALDAEMEVAGPNGRRTIQAAKFFLELMQTAVQPNEILCEIRVPITAGTVAYVKTAQKASGFAIAGVAVVLDKTNKRYPVAINGVAVKAYRAKSVERSLNTREITPEAIRRASEKAARDVEALNDIHASAEFRSHLACLNTRKALELAASRA